MVFEHGEMRMNVEGDRLSSLPDDLIHKILSFLDITAAIETSALSSRWRFIWTSMPYLKFSSEDFSTLPKFSKFVTRVLSRRDNLTNLYSLKLSFRGKVSQVFVKRILHYAFSHNIQQLNVVCLLVKDIELPLSIFSSQSLKQLSLTMQNGRFRQNRDSSNFFTPTSSLDLPLLTTLNLYSVILCDDKCIGVFSKCANLKNLTLSRFRTTGSNGFSISHPRLSNLTLENGFFSVKVLNVITPQLENLTTRFCDFVHVVSAPGLISFTYKGYYPLQLSTEGFHSLEKAHICLSCTRGTDADAHQMISLLQQLPNVKFLTLNNEFVELLSSSMELLLCNPSPFLNMKSLKIYPETVNSWDAPKKVAISTKLRSYLLDGSPGSTLIIVLPEEVLAWNLMAELRVLLEEEKDNSKSNSAQLERGKTRVESHEPKKLKIGNYMDQVEYCWTNLSVEINSRKEKARVIISKLQSIERLLTKLPTSFRTKIQPCLSGLFAEAGVAVSKITDCMKMECNKNQRRLSFYFHELATTLQSSS